MGDLISIAQKLSGLSLGTLLLAILYGSWRDWWCWSRDRDRAVAAVKEDRDDWRRIALQSLGGLEKSNEQAVRIAAASPPLGLAAITGRTPARERPPDSSAG